MLEILEARHGRKSNLVTRQVPVADWHGLIGQATFAAAIPGRLVHNAHRIEIVGESPRRTRAAKKA